MSTYIKEHKQYLKEREWLYSNKTLLIKTSCQGSDQSPPKAQVLKAWSPACGAVGSLVRFLRDSVVS